jgi:hypothetical protein
MESTRDRRQKMLIAALAILCAIVILGLPVAYYARHRWHWAQFNRMGDEAEALGGHCNITARAYIHQGINVWDEGCIEDIQLADSSVTDAELLRWPIAGSKELEDVVLASTRVTDRGLSAFQGLSCVRYLCLQDTAITGRGLATIQTMSGLEDLDLDGTQIQAKDLPHLSSLNSLKELSLARTSIDGTGLKHLRSLSNLETLDLTGTKISDQDLIHLLQLKELKELGLERTQVTPSGLKMLETKLPNCNLMHEYYFDSSPKTD